MDSSAKKSELGKMLKSALKDKSISMRKLSKITGIDTATISRIINGKQSANINHMEKFSEKLGIPMEILLKSDGYNVGIKENDSSEMLDAIDSLNYKCDTEKINEELNKYQQYALTEEGKNIIYKNFEKKLTSVNGSGFFVEKLESMYKAFSGENLSKEKQSIIGSALLYFILSTDIIPDYIFPIGYIDDITALKLVDKKLEKLKEG